MDIKMDKDDSVALEKSIKVWENRTAGENIPQGRENCPLCMLAEERNGGFETCTGCIIPKHTGKVMCLGTPYSDLLVSNKNRNALEVEFLKSLRQYSPIQAGDIVNNFDGSYHLRLTDIGLTDLGNICYDKDGVKYRYVVVSTGLTLPSSGGRFGKNANDTIIRDLNTNEYIFTMERFLRKEVVEKEICSECGTEL